MDIQALRKPFDETTPLTVGIEEELMLLDAETLDLAPRAPELQRALGGDPRFKLELPAAQLELLTPPSPTVGGALGDLRAAREDLDAIAASLGLRVAGAGAHPFAAPLGASPALADARDLLAAGGDATRQRAVGAARGPRGLTKWLADRFLADEPAASGPARLRSGAGGYSRPAPHG